MWQPDPHWRALPGGRGTLSAGMWLAEGAQGPRVIKRIRRPGPDDDSLLEQPDHPGYWRREWDVASDDGVRGSLVGLVAPRVLDLSEDDEGYVVTTEFRPGTTPPALFVVSALGRFASAELPQRPWLARNLLRRRLALTEERGGWPTLQRTTAADLADLVWSRRHAMLDRYDALPAAPHHGDAAPANFVAADDVDVVTIDWGSLGLAPAGADLGYFALSCREDFDVLLKTYLAAMPPHADAEAVAFAARLHAVFTVLSQAEWALARAARGEGALAGKYRHPALAPYLRALQRQFPQIEALLQG